MRAPPLKYLLGLMFVLVATSVYGMKHHLKIKHDGRKLFKIEDFGFLDQGTMELRVRNFNVKSLKMKIPPKIGDWGKGKPKASTDKVSQPEDETIRAGFLLRKEITESGEEQDIEKTLEKHECLIDKKSDHDFFLDMSDQSAWEEASMKHTMPKGTEGLYTLVFVRCEPTRVAFTQFELDIDFMNGPHNYLSAGDMPLPHIYMLSFFLFSGALITWVVYLRKNAGQIQKIHHTMTALLVFKVLSVLFESLRYHHMRLTGTTELWSVVYFVFAFVKGILLFVVILLIGTGWSMVKPFLNKMEKRIIFVVLCLQVVANVAMVVLGESAPGSESYSTWRGVLHLVDILCCAMVLFPIVWSIRHQRQAVEADGKAARTLERLRQFRQFYLAVIGYVYFTRIIVLVVVSTMPFKLLWLHAAGVEACNLVFYVWTGFRFRPAAENPYLVLRGDDEEDEFLGGTNGQEEGVEMANARIEGTEAT